MFGGGVLRVRLVRCGGRHQLTAQGRVRGVLRGGPCQRVGGVWGSKRTRKVHFAAGHVRSEW